MHPRTVAAATPDKLAIVMAGTGQTLSYGDLVDRSNRVGHLLAGLGLERGDHIASLMENHLHYYEPVWAALNTGLYFTSLSTLLTPEELAYILKDCEARVLFTSAAMADTVAELMPLVPGLEYVFMLDGAISGTVDYESAIADLLATPLADERQGAFMVYSSGTTGFPKGIKPALPDLPVDEPMGVLAAQLGLYEFHGDTVYLSPAPLYHTAPLKWNLTVQLAGGCCVVMDKFDAEQALALIERYRITLAQFVPTMFIRMLALPEAVRGRYDLTSLVQAVHAAAPCPPEIKRRMIDWLGPIVDEYYAGSESNGLCLIRCAEWLERPGSVGRSVRGPIHIMDESGEAELAPGEPGLIYFEGGTPFVYHNDPEKTAAAHNSRGWSAIGDVGYLDEEGYLYLTDRRQDMIISGGVNIYPREAEQHLAVHPSVYDVAVLGVPDPEFGEKVCAFVQPVPGADVGMLAEELHAWLAERLAGYKAPRIYEFVDELPRTPAGKMRKTELREKYLNAPESATHETQKERV
jgi:acyl-CoA synthetase (AMP-forming)/AMP-acid ligase II